jgi:hypothetical protein
MVAAALGAIALVASALFLASPAQESDHADGAGPLGSVGEVDQIVDAVPATGNPVTTFGIPLCVTDGKPSKIVSVSAWKAVGQFTLLGTRIRTFVPSGQDKVIYATDGFPPRVPDTLLDPAGVEVSNACGAPVGGPYTELLVGMSAVDGGTGGGWQGVAVHYTSSGRSLVLRITQDLIICGQTTAAWCTGGSPPTPPPN